MPSAQDTPVDALLAHIKAAGDLYHRLILVVAPSGAGKTATLRAVAAHAGVQVVNLNLELSRRLLDLTERRRALEVPSALDEILGRDTPLVLLDNTEILFDPALQQHPLRLPATRVAQPDDRCFLERHRRRPLPELRGSRPS